ncbi:hypothetical protein BJV74DRAFT_799663 [Russula compacta]|nr:hypothetical protein BJV74DRAFT_799663 [Russula compacta]
MIQGQDTNRPSAAQEKQNCSIKFRSAGGDRLEITIDTNGCALSPTCDFHAENGDGFALASSESVQNISSPTNASASASAGAGASSTTSAAPSPEEATPDSVTATMAEAPLWLREILNQLITKHPKVMSGIPMVLVTAGGVVLIPGIFEGTVLAHPAVKVGGAIAVAFGRWLKTEVDSAANSTSQAQASG